MLLKAWMVFQKKQQQRSHMELLKACVLFQEKQERYME